MKKKSIIAKKKVVKPRLRTFIVWLSNHTSRLDDETIEVKAHTKEEAKQLARFDSTRFSIRTVLTLTESKSNWV